MDTWIFLGCLFLASVGVLAFYGWAISGYHPPGPRDDLLSPKEFEADRMHDPEIDLGQHWRSTDDPGAQWHVWWLAESHELIGLRTGAMPPPVGNYFGSGMSGSRNLQQKVYTSLPYCGMKVLGHFEHRPARGLCEHLRVLPNGLDVLCGGTHGEIDITS